MTRHRGRGRASRARTATALLALAVMAGLAATTTPPTASMAAPRTAAPAEVAPERAVNRPVYRTDGVDGRMDTYASQVSGAHIWDLEVVGTTIYVAGKFTEVVQVGGSWPRQAQPFLAAFDTVTGRWRDRWRPQLNRPAYALDTLPSGAIVAAGEFTRANGVPAEGIVALDPTTGATDRRFVGGVRRPNSNRFPVIRDLYLKGRWLYAVGNFGQAVGPTGGTLDVDKAVRFDATTGVPDPAWRPRLAGPTAYGVAVSTDGLRVHLGGEFSSVNGARGTELIATVNVSNGRLTQGWDHGSHNIYIPVWPEGGVVFDLDVRRNSLYLAGAEHFWERRDSRTGRKLHLQRISNDGQTVEVAGDRVYVGCHCFHRDPTRQVWEINGVTGQPLPGRTGVLQSGDGTWATAVAPDGCLWLGGDFNSATWVAGLGRGEFWVGRLARLCPAGGPEAVAVPEPADGPVNPPWWTGPSAS
jgi:trimeric autotransporter adhesin